MAWSSRLRNLCGALLLAWGASAGAYVIGFAPAAGSHPLGTAFSVDIVISGLQTDGQVVSTYDLTVGFNSAVLQLTGAAQSGALGPGSLFFSTPGAGSVNLFELAAAGTTDAQLAGL